MKDKRQEVIDRLSKDRLERVLKRYVRKVEEIKDRELKLLNERLHKKFNKIRFDFNKELAEIS